MTAGAVTSEDGGVALMSATGVVNYSGVISGTEDISLASAQDLTVNQRIETDLGTISIVSTEGSVKVNTALNSGFNTYVAAKRNVTTLGIRSLGDVALESELGQVITNGNIRSSEGDIFVSRLSRVSVRDIISLGGDVSVISDASSIKTGYIRTDSEDRQGNVDLNALTNIRVAGVVNIEGTDYSIYAGDEGTIAIAHQQLRSRPNDHDFVIGNIARSGTLALASTSIIISGAPVPPPVPIIPAIGGAVGALIIFAIILDAGGTAPAHQDEMNPITGKPYSDEAEYDFVQTLIDTSTSEQQSTVRKVWNTPKYLIAQQGTIDELVEYSEEDEQGRRCIGFPLPIHLGNEENPFTQRHNEYATHVTGSPGDFLLIPPLPIALSSNPMASSYSYVIYDGKAQPGSRATTPTVYYPNSGLATDVLRPEPAYSLAEVKTGHDFLDRIYSGNPLPARRNIPSDMERLDRLAIQVNKEALVAIICKENYFVSFDKLEAARAAGDVLTPKILPSLDVIFHHINPPYSY
ncbi:MAG: hypothetical protein AAFQ80_06555 [Cyanobacteria bacterium J06621_8]